MISKKEALVIGVLAIGGIAAAASVAGKGEDLPSIPRSSLSGGGGGFPVTPLSSGLPIIPEQPNVIFPDPVDYSNFLQNFLGAPISPTPSSNLPGAGLSYSERQRYAEKAGVTSKPPKGWSKKKWNAYLGIKSETKGSSSVSSKSSSKKSGRISIGGYSFPAGGGRGVKE